MFVKMEINELYCIPVVDMEQVLVEHNVLVLVEHNSITLDQNQYLSKVSWYIRISNSTHRSLLL